MPIVYDEWHRLVDIDATKQKLAISIKVGGLCFAGSYVWLYQTENDQQPTRQEFLSAPPTIPKLLSLTPAQIEGKWLGLATIVDSIPADPNGVWSLAVTFHQESAASELTAIQREVFPLGDIRLDADGRFIRVLYFHMT